jgi:hypothetical protein
VFRGQEFARQKILLRPGTYTLTHSPRDAALEGRYSAQSVS